MTVASPVPARETAASGAPAAHGAAGRTIVLVGLMGAGKTTIGRRLARALDLPFRDADREIERASGLSIADLFAIHGEAEFRRGERAVIARLLTEEPRHVLATGGGAFMDPETRELVRDRGFSVWLKAGLDVLVRRVARRRTRPLLLGADPAEVLAGLMARRHPIYAEADLTLDSGDEPHEQVVDRLIAALGVHDGR